MAGVYQSHTLRDLSLVLTCIGPEAKVASPVSGVDEHHIRVDIGPARPTADDNGWVDDRTVLKNKFSWPSLIYSLQTQSHE